MPADAVWGGRCALVYTPDRSACRDESRCGDVLGPCDAQDMDIRRTDYPPVGHPQDYLRGLVGFILLVLITLAVAFVVSLVVLPS